MARPTNRQQFAEFCLRKLGKPVIEINVSPDQVDDAIDQALDFWTDYHFDGVQKAYFKYQVTAADIANRYIKLPDNIIGAVYLYPISDPAIQTDNLFNIRYQIALNDLYTLTSVSMVPYVSVMQHLGIFEEILVGKQPFQYNRKNNIMYIDMLWIINPGEYLLVECYKIVDPITYPKVWSDRWLQNLAAAYIKERWANNLSKFNGIQLIGGVSFNGAQLKQDAINDIAKSEKEIYDNMMPTENYVG